MKLSRGEVIVAHKFARDALAVGYLLQIIRYTRFISGRVGGIEADQIAHTSPPGSPVVCAPASAAVAVDATINANQNLFIAFQVLTLLAALRAE